jgi:hypothetical protein
MRAFLSLIWVLLVSALGLGEVSGRTWNVFNDGSGDAPFVGAAIDSAADGDTILVWPGTYAEERPLAISDKSLAMISANGPYETRIRGGMWITGPDAQYQGTVILSGFRILPVNEPGFHGGPFYLSDLKSFELSECIIDGFGDNAEILDVDDLHVHDCIFRNNHNVEGDDGGALRITSARGGEIRECVFESNSSTAGVPGEEYLGGGGALFVTGYLTITECLFAGNECPSSGAVYAQGEIIFSRNTVIRNESGDGAVFLVLSLGGDVSQNVFAWNRPFGFWNVTSPPGTGCWCNAYWQNEGWDDPDGHDGQWLGPCLGVGEDAHDLDNIYLDPRFCDPESHDFRLMEDSPLLPENHPDDVETCKGILGAFDVGCDPLPPPPAVRSTTWGQMKVRYRE